MHSTTAKRPRLAGNASAQAMGQAAGSAQEIQVRNPRTGKTDYTISALAPDAVTAVAKELRAAQPAWASKGPKARGDIVKGWAAGLAKNSALLEALVVDTGRRKTAEVEVNAIAGIAFGGAMAAERLLDESKTRRDSRVVPTVGLSDQFEPLGLVGVISPWNFPLLLALIDTIPALLAGNAVILKPSEVTPRFAEPLKASIEAIPDLAAIFKVVLGDKTTGAAVVDTVDAVAFTGSVATGKIIARAAAGNFIPCFLELGGKDPLVVLPSADLEMATKIALRASVQATGQACQSLERVYVPKDKLEAFTELLVQKAKAVELSFPDPGQGQLGPIIFGPQADTIMDHVNDAKAKGAKVLCGGELERHGGGSWIRPTVLMGVSHDMKVMKDETFGPVIPVMGYDSLDEAVTLANDSIYGLSAAVVGADAAECEEVARRLKAGAVSINDGAMTAFVYDAAHNVYGYSGLGECRQGDTGLTRYVKRKCIMVQRGEAKAIEENDEKFAASRPAPAPEAVLEAVAEAPAEAAAAPAES